MQSLKITPVIMSGGSGTRLWPLSHSSKPKQFHALTSNITMLQETILRVTSTEEIHFLPPVIICANSHRDIVDEQIRAIDRPIAKLVLEPFGRNTAAAAYIAASVVNDLDPMSLVLLLPADHVVADPISFMKVIAAAAEVARSRIVTFGIEADGPETGYGYIKKGDFLSNGVFTVRKFAEKPDRDTAIRYLSEGDYTWNAGIFLFSPQIMMQEMNKYAPNIADQSAKSLEKSSLDGSVVALDPNAFDQCPSEPIDIAVMEKTSLAAVAPCNMGWADVGSWSELHRIVAHDVDDNFLHGAVAVIDSSNNLIWSEGPPVAVIGVSNLVIVSTKEGVIVLPMDRSQDVKIAVSAIKELKY